MSTKTKDKVTVELILLDHILPTPDNPRKISKTAKKTIELAESIKQFGGVLQPVIVREHPTKKAKYELCAGQRRWIASQIAGMKTIRASIMKLDDQQAFEVTMAENMQREDLTPLQEAGGIQAYIKKGWDLSSIASKLGKSERWVQKRRQVFKLSPLWKKELENEDSEFNEWPIGHLELLSGLLHSDQDRILREYKRSGGIDIPNRSEIRDDVSNCATLLHYAKFDTSSETLDPKAGSCRKCPKRSSRQKSLFDELDDLEKKTQSTDRCLDTKCWDRKLAKHAQNEYKKARKDHGSQVKVITQDGRDLLNLSWKDEQKVRLPSYGYSKVSANSKGAIPVFNKSSLKIEWMKPGPGSGSPSNGSKNAKGSVTPLKDRKKKLEKRRWAIVQARLQEFIRDHEFPLNDVTELLRFAAVFGTFDHCVYADRAKGEEWGKYLAINIPDARKKIAQSSFEILENRISAAEPPVLELKLVANFYDAPYLDWKKEADRELPDPKSWKFLNADGTPKTANKKGKKKAAKTKNKK